MQKTIEFAKKTVGPDNEVFQAVESYTIDMDENKISYYKSTTWETEGPSGELDSRTETFFEEDYKGGVPPFKSAYDKESGPTGLRG